MLAVNGYILFCSNIPEDCEREYIEDMFMDQGMFERSLFGVVGGSINFV